MVMSASSKWRLLKENIYVIVRNTDE